MVYNESFFMVVREMENHYIFCSILSYFSHKFVGRLSAGRTPGPTNTKV
jgi:hypothetical protein